MLYSNSGKPAYAVPARTRVTGKMISGVATTVPLTLFVSASAEGSLNVRNVSILLGWLPCACKEGVQEEDEASDNKEDDSSSED